MSLIEVVMATVLLGMIATTVFGALSYTMGAQVREQRMLASAEVANRMMLQYLDDSKNMPDSSLPVQYGRDFYRWSLSERSARIVPAKADVAEARQRRGSLSLDRFKAVTVQVWLSERSGGGAQPGTGPQYALTRIVDPAMVFRNPDSMDNLLKRPGGIDEILKMFSGGAAGRDAFVGSTQPSTTTGRSTPSSTFGAGSGPAQPTKVGPASERKGQVEPGKRIRKGGRSSGVDAEDKRSSPARTGKGGSR
jgi:type II secretory pathway pseudopilin PulG